MSGLTLYPANPNVDVKSQDSGSIDAFGRWRVSNPITLFDSKQVFDDGDIADSAENFPLYFDNQEISGGSTTTTFDVDAGCTTLGVGATTAGVRVRQTKMRFNYQPGKSQLIFCTFSEFDTSTGIYKGVGYYDDNNGLFFESDEGVVGVTRRTYVSGSAVDNTVVQSSWNLDTMDGNGKSGITLDFTKTQIAVIDFEWLGVGRVRMGFVVDGLIYYCHEFLNANSLSTVYMSTPNLPIRYEIQNDATGAADDFISICSSVISEGGQDSNGALHAHDNAATAIGVTTTKEVLLAIRQRTTHIGQTVDLEFLNIIQSTSSTTWWELHLNPTLSGTPTYANLSNSGMQVAVGGGETVSSDGYVVASGYLIGTNQAKPSANKELLNAIRLGSLIDGTRDEFVLVARSFSGTSTLLSSLSWRELN